MVLSPRTQPSNDRVAEPRHPAAGPAVAMLQITDVPRGLQALDALVKEAPVEILATGTVQCGHYLIAFGGQLEATLRSFARAMNAACDEVQDSVLLPDAEARIVPAFRDGVVRPLSEGDTLGVVQSAVCPVILGAVDAALKGAEVDLLELRVAEGLGGKALAMLWGKVHDVEAAIELVSRVVAAHEGLARGAVTTAVIPNADAEVQRAVSSSTRFYREWRG
jgi:microcompartment protein CcmL/EutN